MVCASEQAAIVSQKIYDQVKQEFIKRNCYFLNHDELEKMRKKITPFTPEMSFEDMIQALGKMTLRELLAERCIDTDSFDRLNAELGQIPNI